MGFYKTKSSGFRRLLLKIPGRDKFGVYRLLPLFFALGAGIEFAMIFWHVGEVNFCKSEFILFFVSKV
jgi:hypothetical protein